MGRAPGLPQPEATPCSPSPNCIGRMPSRATPGLLLSSIRIFSAALISETIEAARAAAGSERLQ